MTVVIERLMVVLEVQQLASLMLLVSVQWLLQLVLVRMVPELLTVLDRDKAELVALVLFVQLQEVAAVALNLGEAAEADLLLEEM
jgi:hypothetical protein